MKNKILSLILTFFFVQSAVFAQNSDTFNLSGVIENIINYQNKYDFVSDIRTDANEKFLYAMENMQNGNVIVAYSEFSKTIEALDKNIGLLMLAKKLYELGFFSLGDVAISKISGRDKIQTQIEKLKTSYKPYFSITKDEETYLAKIYTSIYYNNSPEEAAFNLIKKNALLENSDYANFIMAQSMFECRQYNQALIYVDKAIEKNGANSNYKFFKAKTLLMAKKYKEALKYIELNENTISIYFKQDLKILKQEVLMNLALNDSDKKFYQIYSYYLAGNYYKTLKETNNILNFNKNNPKILTLQALSHLALGEDKLAYEDLTQSLKLNKKFNLTLMGLADYYFINGNYKEAQNIYKKLIKTDLNDEAVLKNCLALQFLNLAPNQNVEKIKNQIENNSFYEYLMIANNLFYNDLKNKNKYTAKSLGVNFLYPKSWDVVLDSEVKMNKFDNIDQINFILTFSGELNAEYYYYSALSLNDKNQKKEAFYELKKAVNLDPDFKPAIDLINKLQNELI